jgi:alpha-beta hydrolase superfamily lysophospholipase
MRLPHSLQQTVPLRLKIKQAVDSSDGSFRSATGKNIFYRCWAPAKPRAILLLAHGLAEHSGRYGEVASFFADAGIATYALDLPGHGKSDGKRGHIGGFEEYTEALGQLLSLARQAHPELPFILLGHSMGGLVAADFLLQHQSEFVAAVLTGAAIQSPQQPSSIVLFVNRVIAAVMPRFGVLRMDASGISRDPQVVSDYENDPLVYRGKATAGLVTALFSAMNRVVANAESIRLPMLIMHGSVDSLTAVKGSKLLHDTISSEDKKIVIYDGLYHEILNEPERKNVMADILRWVEIRIGDYSPAG